MKMMCTSVLAFEVIVVLLSIPVALMGDARTGLVLTCSLVLAGALIVATALVRKPYGITLGWILQAWILLYGFLVPWMFVVGGIFVILWWAAIHYGSRVEAAGRLAQDSDSPEDS